MPQYSFGVGSVTLLPTITNPTPVQVGILQDLSFDVAMSTKELRGSSQFPVDVARAAGKVSGKLKFAQIFGDTFASLLNVAAVAGSKLMSTREPITPTANAATVAPPNGGTFFEDLGVLRVATGQPMKRVAAPTNAGEYAVTALGVYSFAATDANPPVLISYSYSSAALGKTVPFVNQPMGSSVLYTLSAFNSFRGKSFGCRLYAVTIPKISWALKQEDYTEFDLDFDAFADPITDKVFDIWTND